VVGTGNSACGGTDVDLIQAVRNIVPIRALRSGCFLFMPEL
jgi:hypothetical protein